MIKLSTLDKREIFLNPELIEQLESVPETVVTLTNGKKLLVAEPAEAVVERVMQYRRQIHSANAPLGTEVK